MKRRHNRANSKTQTTQIAPSSRTGGRRTLSSSLTRTATSAASTTSDSALGSSSSGMLAVLGSSGSPLLDSSSSAFSPFGSSGSFSSFSSSAGVGSGSKSMLRCLQSGQTHSLDLCAKTQNSITLIPKTLRRMNSITYSPASRLRSAGGYSIDPTPTAAWPLSGKKPCSPIIAKRKENKNKVNNPQLTAPPPETKTRARLTCPHTPCRLPQFFVVYVETYHWFREGINTGKTPEGTHNW